MQRDVVKGAAFGGVVVAVSLVAVSLVDPRQPRAPVAEPPVQSVAAQMPPAAESRPVAKPVQIAPPRGLPALDEGASAAVIPAPAPAAAMPSAAAPIEAAAPDQRLEPAAPPKPADAGPPPAVTAEAPSEPAQPPDGAATAALPAIAAAPPLPQLAQAEAPSGPDLSAAPAEPAPPISALARSGTLAPDVAADDLATVAAQTAPEALRSVAPLSAPQSMLAPGPQVFDFGPLAALAAPVQQASGFSTAPAPRLLPRPPRPELGRPAIEAGLPAANPAGTLAEPDVGVPDEAAAAQELSQPELREPPPPAVSAADAEPDPAAADPEPEVAGRGAADVDADPALERYAAAVSPDPDLPMLALVLWDEGADAQTRAALADLPFRVSVLLSGAREDAAEAMAFYRAAGHEVVLLAPLPEGAGGEEAAATLDAYLARVPEAVALMEAVPGGLNPTPEVAEAVAAELEASGRGLLLWQAGLNPVEGFSAGYEPPSVAISRDIDGNGQDKRAILRFVDAAAARSAPAQPLAILGRITPETLAALAEWEGTPRSEQVSVVPVSSILLAR